MTGKRQTEFGYDVITAPLPAVVAVSDAINEPRYPSLKGIMSAKSKPTETLSLADIGADADRVGTTGSRTSVLALAPPPAKGEQIKIEDDGSAAERARRLARGEEAPVTHARLSRAPRRRDPEGLARRARARARRSAATSPESSSATASPTWRPRQARYGASTVLRRRRPRVRGAASAAARRRARGRRCRIGCVQHPLRRIGSLGRRRGRPLRPSRRRPELGRHRLRDRRWRADRPATCARRHRARHGRLDEHATHRARALGCVRAGRDGRYGERSGRRGDAAGAFRPLHGWSSRRRSRRAGLRSRTPT